MTNDSKEGQKDRDKSSTAFDSTWTPPLVGNCPKCGGLLYAGMTHLCTTGVYPKVIYPGTSVIAPGLSTRVWP